MQIPIRIHFHNLDCDAQIEEQILRECNKLKYFRVPCLACSVGVELNSIYQNYLPSDIYEVYIRLILSDGEIYSHPRPYDSYARNNLHVAVRDSFNVVRHQLAHISPHHRCPLAKHAWVKEKCTRVCFA